MTGYQLYSDRGLPGNQFLIYDGDGATQIQEYTDSDLLQGVLYQYTLEVLNFNGPSEKSDPVYRTACTGPDFFASLSIVQTTSELVKLSWR